MAQSSNAGSHKLLLIGIVVIAAIFALVIVFGKSTPNKLDSATTGSTPASAAIIQDVTSVPASVLESVGVGSATVYPRTLNSPSLTQGSKPEVFYEGAEYCPYCATERWAVAIALSRFGTLTKLGITHSSSSDVYPNTQTLSFFQSNYTSNYITFVPVEIYTNIPDTTGYTTLQTPTKAESALVNKYDNTPYVPASEVDSIPFIDFGGKFLITGATYSPTVLQNKSAAQIGAALSVPTSQIAKGADGAANTITAAICSITHDQPSSVCDSTMQGIEALLK
jgi:hypothetical protein